MSATEAIEAVDKHWLDCFTLSIDVEDSALLNSDIDIDELLDTDKLVEGQFLFQQLPLVVLIQTCCIDVLVSNGERAEIGILNLLNLPLWQDEGELGKLGLSFLLHLVPHSLQNSRLMDLVSLRIGSLLLIFFDLRMEIRMSVTVKLPDVDSIVFCG